MSRPLNPWDDASILAQRLQCTNARVYIIIGATEWCSRCRDVRVQFDLYADHPLLDETWLWLDLVEHGEFIGDYQPENLPMLILYQGAQLLACLEIETVGHGFEATVDLLRTPSLSSGEKKHRSAITDPGIRERLLVQDWAVE
ncbi:hypothetical protein IV454_07960 [Massilia antarctica]|uniref:Thioredoxin family protein n=1 Tax=Massilia antarctica TaxID=2765360 RepID=A0AA49A9H7_9BURK|nr:hypothetical protein [Massilia antarctica]QPI51439.1 hypothetical protein IV454_07960 [Massilia antarctica]